MTDQHPLTRKICHEIVDGTDPSKHRFQYTNFFIEDYMRAGADWQLEQVIEWLKSNTTDYMGSDYDMTSFLPDTFLEDLREEMRPTQDDN